MSNRDYTSYLLVIDTSQSSIESVRKTIDKIPEVANWLSFLPSAMVLVSRLDIASLHGLLKAALPGQRYLLTVLEAGKKRGWLPTRAWDIMNEPQPA